MNRTMRRISSTAFPLLLAIAILWFTVASSAAAEEVKVGGHKLSISLTDLKDPSTFALAVGIKPAPEATEQAKLQLNLDLVVAAERNLNEKGNFSLSYATAWQLHGKEIPSPIEGLPPVRQRYPGKAGIDIGLESGPEKVGNNAAGDWKISNNTLGLVVEQSVPYTRFKMPWCTQETWPLIVGASYKYVYSRNDQKNDWRTSFFADWEIPIVSSPAVSAFLGMRGEWYDNKDGRDYDYGEGRLQVSFPSLIPPGITKSFGEPMVFTKYIKGQQPPNFAAREEWQFGIGTKYQF